MIFSFLWAGKPCLGLGERASFSISSCSPMAEPARACPRSIKEGSTAEGHAHKDPEIVEFDPIFPYIKE